jgi:hypothetical protein
MSVRLQATPDAGKVGVTLRDLAATTVGGRFRLVYLVRSTIENLNTEQKQVECFRSAAPHLEPGGAS